MSVPRRAKVAIIGGGPAGSLAATLLAREGVEAVVLERDKFPRYHIGESLLTSIRPIFEFIGLAERVEKYGFVKKYRAFFRLKQGMPAGCIDFSRSSQYDYSYQVIRSEFDKLLLDYAGEMGARVFEETRVTDVDFSGTRPVALRWEGREGASGRLEFDYLIDASGMAGFVASRYLKNRTYQEYFANVAVGRYWKDFQHYRDDSGQVYEGAFSMEAIPDGSGWVWAIPLHDQTLSVGVVVHVSRFQELRHSLGEPEQVYHHVLSSCPDMMRLLEGATPVSSASVWKDYSYMAERFSGPGLRLAGDAACFIDPFFSTGIHMALLGALSSAASICAVQRGEATEEEAATYHDRCIRSSYMRLAMAVAGVYRQIRDQEKMVLTGITREDFQRAFDLLQPLISGNLDLNKSQISEETMSATLEYLGNMVLDMHNLPSRTSEVSKLMVQVAPPDSLTEISRLGAIDGLHIRLERGQLGLQRLTVEERLQDAEQVKGLQAALQQAARATAQT